jgi:alanine dehydrogenase
MTGCRGIIGPRETTVRANSPQFRKEGVAMRVGVPKEVKQDEYRVAMMPVGAESLVKAGHEVYVETHAGMGSGFADEDYARVGAKIVPTHEEAYKNADLVIKVKEPQPQEIGLFRPGQIVFTYFHFAADQTLMQACLEAEIVAIAYETIHDRVGRLPCLTPMSEIAGKMSIQEGAKYLEKPMMGRGILLGGVPGVEPAHVVILGAGVVGTNAAKVAAGLGSNVILMDVNLDRLRYLDDVMPANVTTVFSDAHTVREHLLLADLVVGAVLIPGAKAPRLVTRKDLVAMKNGSVIVDVAIDQGGCIETSRPTTHQQPTFAVEGVVHYCVTNMPGAVGRTSTIALCNATLPYALKIANLGYERAADEDSGFAQGINLVGGRVTNSAVAESFHMKSQPIRGIAAKRASA